MTEVELFDCSQAWPSVPSDSWGGRSRCRWSTPSTWSWTCPPLLPECPPSLPLYTPRTPPCGARLAAWFKDKALKKKPVIMTQVFFFRRETVTGHYVVYAKCLYLSSVRAWKILIPKVILTAMHCLIMQDCFMRPGPPNFFMSLQKWHSPHSVRRHASHFRQRVLLRLAPDELRLDGSLTADDDVVPILGLGRLAARCWRNEQWKWLETLCQRQRKIHTWKTLCVSQLLFIELLELQDKKLHQHNKRMIHLFLLMALWQLGADTGLLVEIIFELPAFFIYCNGWNEVVSRRLH